MASGALLKIIPAVSMFDAPVRVLVSGLSAGQRVSLFCNAEETRTGADFESNAHYVADSQGVVDCERSESIGGSLTGVHPMGVFWSLKETAKHKRGARLFPIDPTIPAQYALTLRDGHDPNCDGVLAKTVINRHLLHPQVVRQEVQHGRVRGTLFIPKSDESTPKLPAVIDLYGTRGGLNEIRASLLASHGFITLALAFFNYKDLPTSFNDLELEYFDEAIQMLMAHPRTLGQGLGVIGASFGAELALLMASNFPQVKAVASINGLHVLDSFNPIKYKGKTIPTVSADASCLEFMDGHLRYVSYRLNLPDDPKYVFPIEKSQAQFLFLASEDDQATPAVQSYKILMERLRQHGKEKQGELCILPGAGHVLEPPYMPITKALFHKVVGASMIFGGEPMAHAFAQEQSWRKIQQFFAKVLGPPATLDPIHEVNMSSKL